MNKFKKPCLDCGQLTEIGNRCAYHARIRQAQLDSRRDKSFYDSNYRKRAKEVRDNAMVCWICNEGAKPNDPWTADHYFPGNPNSPLLPAHRSCNSRRQNKPA